MQRILKVLALGLFTALSVNTASAQTGTLQGRQLFLYDGGTGSSLNRIAIQTPPDAFLTTNWSLTLPTTGGFANQLLVNTGAGIMNWTSTLTLQDLTLNGDLGVLGNTTLGDLATDLVTVNGTMSFPGLTANYPLQLNGAGQVVSELINLTGAADITGILPVLNGGTGASTAAGARTNLGAQAQSTQLDNLSALASTGIMVRTGVNTFSTRLIAVNAPLSIADADGVAGNPTISLGTVGVANGGTGLTATPANGEIPIGNGVGFSLATITGTANQVVVTNGAGSITLSTPQDIHTAANPTFNNLTLNGNLLANGNTTLGNAGTDVITVTGNTVNTPTAPVVIDPTNLGTAIPAFTGSFTKIVLSANNDGANLIEYADLPAGTDGQEMLVRITCQNALANNSVILRQPGGANTTIAWPTVATLPTVMLKLVYDFDSGHWAILSSVYAPF